MTTRPPGYFTSFYAASITRMDVVKAFNRTGNQAFCSHSNLFCMYVLPPWPSLHIARTQRNEREYLSSIWICMLGNVFFTHRKMGDSRQLCLSLIFQYSCALIAAPQGLSVCCGILGTETINIREQNIYYSLYYDHSWLLQFPLHRLPVLSSNGLFA